MANNLRGTREMTRRYERGSVVGFVLIGMLLTAALVGGVWFARHPLGSSAQTASDSNTTSDDKSSSEEKDASDTTTTKSTTDEELKTTLAQQAAQSSSQKTNTSTTSSPSATTSTKLPTTGPADTVFEMIGAAMLSGMTVAYVRSRSVA